MEQKWTTGLTDSISTAAPVLLRDLFTDRDSREYCGDFWYETDFFVPGEWSGKDIIPLWFRYPPCPRVFVNGVEIAQHAGGFLPFSTPFVTDIVRYNQYNKVSRAANNELNEYMLPAGATAVLSNGKKIAAPYFALYNYAGVCSVRSSCWLCPLSASWDYSVTTASPRRRRGGLHGHHHGRPSGHCGAVRHARPRWQRLAAPPAP